MAKVIHKYKQSQRKFPTWENKGKLAFCSQSEQQNKTRTNTRSYDSVYKHVQVIALPMSTWWVASGTVYQVFGSPPLPEHYVKYWNS